MKLRVGDWVEVKSKEEILRTLDKKGRMEGLPFMPQMFKYCGQKFRVFKRAHKTCDWVYTAKAQRLPKGIHLDHRCDGEAFGGCQSACSIFWKEAWLKPVSGSNESAVSSQQSANSISTSVDPSAKSSSCTEADVWGGTRLGIEKGGEEPRYICQGTQVLDFTKPLPWWDIRQYIEDYSSGNVTPGRFIRGLIYAGYNLPLNSGIGLGRPMRWFYDKFQSLWGGIPNPRRTGKIPVEQPTPTCNLILQPGELVRVKSYKEILETLDTKGKNRGLSFDAEMVPYCGGTYRVRSRVRKYVDEKTGKLVIMKNESIILEGVWCQGRYSECRMFCPRSLYPWWHEIWLERVPENMN